MEFRILGPLEVEDDAGRAVPLGGIRRRALLAILLTRANEVVPAERLIHELWGDRPPRTALNTLHYHVSQLRKALGADRIVTRTPGYLARIEPDELDLERFSRLVEDGGGDELREALALWRGPALADLRYEPFAQPEIARLDELRLMALEQRIDADLALGRHAQVVAELEALVAEHPLRERLRAQLMLALYRTGRQSEALDVYRATRRALVDELGIEPGQGLQELEQAILRQDRGLDPPAPPSTAERSILVAVRDEDRLDALIAVAEPLARRPPRELILAAVVAGPADLARATRRVHERRQRLDGRGVSARAAALTSGEPAADVVRLASRQDVDLIVVDGSADAVAEASVASDVATLGGAPCDVAMLLGRQTPCPGPGRPVLVPFGGAEHEWIAVELAAWIASTHNATLTLLGSAAGNDKRDASSLLAAASLLVQRTIGIATEPLLVERGATAVVAAAEEAGLIVVGVSERWAEEGLGETRLAIARQAKPPTLIVRRGLRPGGLAPSHTLSRFTWSLPALASTLGLD